MLRRQQRQGRSKGPSPPQEAGPPAPRRNAGPWTSPPFEFPLAIKQQLASLLRITPRLVRLGCSLIDGPMGQRDTRARVGKDHADARAYADTTHHLRRRQSTIRRREVADDAQGLVLGRLALFGGWVG